MTTSLSQEVRTHARRRPACDCRCNRDSRSALAVAHRLLAENRDLANVQVEGRKGGYRTPLHVVAWPIGLAISRTALPWCACCLRTLPTRTGRRGFRPPGDAAALGCQQRRRRRGRGTHPRRRRHRGAEAAPLRVARHSTMLWGMAAGEWHACSPSDGARVDKLWHAAALGLLTADRRAVAGRQLGGGQQRVLAGLRWWPAPRRRTVVGAWRRPELGPALRRRHALDQADSIDTGRAALVTWLQDQGARSNPRETQA